ncbi:hypothetical protein LSH36_309g00021 [Paralvinella palmiformis]|uniref:Sugar phosphate transporter domain-containing protein n=1 Tax=Paralvinella palmiformis TaxID=53620 RepID=A0AAD9N2H8_9ANNE|nr:hypothetical protein LSH36_309g00021 [Paralvinella palmiformis]
MGRLKRWPNKPVESVKTELTVVKHSICSAKFMGEALTTIGLVLFYYTFSISLTFYNKKFISVYQFPLSITMTHLVMKFLIASLIRTVWSACTGKERITLDWWNYCKRVAPPGIASSLDIGLSNWSFEYITISLYTMTKTTVIIFILAFSILFKLEAARCEQIFVVLLIAIGLFMFTFESTQFSLIGFILVLLASFLSGLRWTLSQIVLQKGEIGLSNPLDMMYHIQPWMMLSLLPLSAGFEGVHIATSEHTFRYHDIFTLSEHLSILMAGAIIAFMLELSEFFFVSLRSGLTLSISGIVKEIFTLVLAASINGDRMSWFNIIGLLICLCGIILHVIIKAVRASEPKEKTLDESVEMLLRNGGANVDDENDDEIDLFNVQRDR